MKTKDLLQEFVAEQELTIYKEALKYFEGDERRYAGFCSYFNNEHDIDVYNEDSFKRIFPRLYNQRPEVNVWVFWFEPCDNKSRAECLRAAIRECEEKQKI